MRCWKKKTSKRIKKTTKCWFKISYQNFKKIKSPEILHNIHAFLQKKKKINRSIVQDFLQVCFPIFLSNDAVANLENNTKSRIPPVSYHIVIIPGQGFIILYFNRDHCMADFILWERQDWKKSASELKEMWVDWVDKVKKFRLRFTHL